MPENTFLAEIEQEGRIAPLGDQAEKETPPASPAVNETTKDEPASSTGEKASDAPASETDATPQVFQAFHKHPRWIALQEELNELRAFRERTTPLLEKLQQQPTKETNEIPAWFIELFGENEVAWKKYNEQTKREREEILKEVYQGIEEKSAKASEDEKKWNKWVNDEFQNIIEDPATAPALKQLGVDTSTKEKLESFRNELFKVTLDYRPTDEEGNINLRLAFDLWRRIKQITPPAKTSVDEKKALSDKTMVKVTTDNTRKDFKNSHDLRGKSFRDLVPNE